jgi:hypothetical protein
MWSEAFKVQVVTFKPAELTKANELTKAKCSMHPVRANRGSIDQLTEREMNEVG